MDQCIPFTYKACIKMVEILVFKQRLLPVSRHELLKALVMGQMCVSESHNPKLIEFIVKVPTFRSKNVIK